MADSCIGCECHRLKLPDGKTCLYPGNIVVLNRFETQRWVVCYGWFAFGGNRKICGWYLHKEHNRCEIKPIEEIDLYDIYIIQA